jgi:hypothetical protein
MPRPLDARLDRVEARKTTTAAERASAALRRRLVWRAEAAMGAVIRDALGRADVDATRATRLCPADEAAASLAALPDTTELPRADDGDAAPVTAHDGTVHDSTVHDRAPEDGFAAKILEMTERFAGGEPLDFANASFAELLAWSLVQPPATAQSGA